MKMIFDLSEDEIPVFQAETNDQLQALDEGLVRLENGERSTDLIQAVFRAAHTLKGAAGMIGHTRMVDATHALETVLDNLRKENICVSTPLIDVCLETVDALRLLRDEVFSGEPAMLDLEGLTAQLDELNNTDAESSTAPIPSPREASHPFALSGREGSLIVQAAIADNSLLPAARAFQIMLALQESGEILRMSPCQAEIEASLPVSRFYAEIVTALPPEQVAKALGQIMEVQEIYVGPAGSPPPAPLSPTAPGSKTAVALSPTEAPRAATAEKTIRTSIQRLDMLMNLVGELITDRNRLYMLRGRLEADYRGVEHIETLSETITHVGRITDQLQTEVMGIRMLPISNVFNKYPRMVRDLSHRANKQVNLVIRGEDTELDRSLIEAINDPLIHLLRNCIDHGIEAPDERLARGKPAAGALLLTARHEQGRIIITAEDDGGGIDVERVKAKAIERGLISEKEAAILSHDEAVELIFVSGLSTAKEITDISGRGVGLDIVRNNIERLNGAISVETHPGQGTLFQINLPLTLAIIPTLLVQVVKGIFAIPLVTVTETLRMRTSEIHTITGRPVIRLRDRVLPVLRLADVFDIHSSSGSKDGETSDYVYIVVVQAGKTQAGLVVDRLVGEQEVVVKSLSALLGDISGISGAAILGDGQVALILDIQGILKDATARQSA